MRAFNIYYLTRVHDPHGISLLLAALSGRRDSKEISFHEAATLWSFTDKAASVLEQRSSGIMHGWLSLMDGFYFSYTIEHISKEFDLLKFSSDSGCVLNIELKSEMIGEDRILKQLEQNRYYLSHIAHTIYSFTYVMETDEIYTLDADGAFGKCTIERLADALALDNLRSYLTEGIENCFRTAEYLISPIAEPDKFLKGKYFLTNQQFDFRRKILEFLQKQSSLDKAAPVISISGIAGCGKTLLLLDLGVELSKQALVLFIHSGALRKGHMELDDALNRIHIISGKNVVTHGLPDGYGYVLIDEADYLGETGLAEIIAGAGQKGIPLVMTYDPHRLLARHEERSGNAGLSGTPRMIEKNSDLSLAFSGNIRINRPVYSFLKTLLHLTDHAESMNYDCIDVLYANDIRERDLIERSYTERGYSLISAMSKDEGSDDIIAREYDRVIMHLDELYYYDDTLHLRVRENEEQALRLLYEGLSRTRESLCLVITHSRELFLRILSIRAGRHVIEK